MIHEKICTYEVCKLAKEKGFDSHCTHFYAVENFTAECVIYAKDFYKTDFEKGSLYLNYAIKDSVLYKAKMLPAPTQSLLQQWLRSNKQWSISVFWDMVTKDYRYEVIKTIGVLEIQDDEEYYYSCPTGFDNYELALEDALKYTLKNLI